MDEVHDIEPISPRGYVWGRIWCILVFIVSIAALISGIIILSNSHGYAYNITLGILLLIASCIYGIDGYGMWVKRSWGLILTYALLVISFVSGLIQLISLFGVEISHGSFAMWLIGNIIRLVIDVLWFCYFFKRRREFT